MSPQFNKEHAASTPKAQWVKEHEHLKDEFDLEKEWKDAQAKEPKAEDKPTDEK